MRPQRKIATRRAFCRLALAAIAATGSIAATFAASDPKTPVAALYAAEQANRPALEDGKLRAETLSRSLAALYDQAEAVERGGGEAVIDFDAVTNSQGAEVKSFSLKLEHRDQTHARVIARIDPGDWLRKSPRENIVDFDLVFEDGRWRIDDITGVAEPRAWSLRDIIELNLRQK